MTNPTKTHWTKEGEPRTWLDILAERLAQADYGVGRPCPRCRRPLKSYLMNCEDCYVEHSVECRKAGQVVGCSYIRFPKPNGGRVNRKGPADRER